MSDEVAIFARLNDDLDVHGSEIITPFQLLKASAAGDEAFG